MPSTNQVANTSTTNIVPVQAVFNSAGVCLGLVGPAGEYFSPPLTADTITGATITGSTIDASTITSTTITAPVLTLIVTTEAALGAIANAINTSGKALGSLVLASDTHTLYTANGSTAGALWYNADGSASITPA